MNRSLLLGLILSACGSAAAGEMAPALDKHDAGRPTVSPDPALSSVAQTLGRQTLLAVLEESAPVEVRIECLGAAPGAIAATCDLAADRRLVQFQRDVVDAVRHLRDLTRALPPRSIEFYFGIEVDGRADGLGFRPAGAELAMRTCSEFSHRLGLRTDCERPNHALACSRGLYVIDLIGSSTLAPLRALPSIDTLDQQLSLRLTCTEHTAIGSEYRGVTVHAWLQVMVRDMVIEQHARTVLLRAGWQVVGGTL